ncbi:2Fe-2S iron-sulfur cluster-binding protein [Thermoflavimicrobium dichotomicum]|uniref:Ferredoxin n=1 Tax=Thermoflavimicrobium dichotomicum TaxID=46223 RepID=A0A1I3S5W6_9BACL|nr:2Fe-2S iron-sulfur cluster-binding protein [Thermoflavimicrobium dichotomicum]SFJ53780.1 Ferredoxin [Thermoflavimicrobium dichotomicum]
MRKKQLTVGSLLPGTKGEPAAKSEQTINLSTSRTTTKHKMTSQPFIKVKQHDRIFTLTPHSGKTMLEAALSQNQLIDYKCRKGNCGKCKVRVMEGSELISSPTSKELGKLKKELAEGYRLACQTIIN